MKKILLLVIAFTVLIQNSLKSQVVNNPFIKDMQWGIDFQIHLTMSNDSSFVLNVNDLIHANSSIDSSSSEFVYYPVMLASDFVNQLNTNKININSASNIENPSDKPVSLWSALHSSLGGGWIHFLNCMVYSLESGYLDPKAPLMVRPITSWKPNPVTTTYLRTKKWKYYIPYEQKYAKKEYKLKKKENQLNNLQQVPKEWVNMCLITSQNQFEQLKSSNDYKSLAKINLVKILLGANYLGKAQISYIQTMVQKAMLQYSFNRLPSIIVFDDIQVAVAMALDEKGYRVEKIVFRNVQNLTPVERFLKETQENKIISSINKLNQKLFEQKLKKYYL